MSNWREVVIEFSINKSFVGCIIPTSSPGYMPPIPSLATASPQSKADDILPRRLAYLKSSGDMGARATAIERWLPVSL